MQCFPIFIVLPIVKGGSVFIFYYILFVAQSETVVMAASSYFLHFLKASEHAFIAFLTFSASLENLHCLTAWTVLLKPAPPQHAQAMEVLDSRTVSVTQALASLSNRPASVSHSATLVLLGWGQLEVLQDLVISEVHKERVPVRFFSWTAPLFVVLPLQVRLSILFPPANMRF